MDLSGKPYYDRSEESIKKNYSKLAFKPDVPLQQSELNELQALIEHHLKTSGDAIFSDGDIVSGFDFDITEITDGGLNINFHEGMIYLDGKVRKFDGGTAVITGVGDETIHAYIESDIVTHVDDPSLLDPTIGAPSESSQGSDRVREIVKIGANDPEYTKIFDFEEGKLLVTVDKPGVDKIMDVLAERTYDESGSYRVAGYELYVDNTQETGTEVSLIATAGKAYIRGYKVEKPSSTRIPIRKSTDSREVIDESQVYYDKIGAVTHQRVTLNNRPVEAIRSVTGQVTQVNATVTRNSSSRLDTLGHTGVTTIESFRVAGAPISYTQGVDYQLINGNQIQWLVGGRAPTSSSTYQVTYRYTKTFIRGVDYELLTTTEVDSNGMPAYYLSFSIAVNKPVDGTSLSITYTYYLSRKDLVMLDRLGKFTIIEGQPSTIDSVVSPNANDPLTLPIGTITVFPNSLTATTNSETVTNIPFEKLQKLVARVQTLEYNMSTMAMDISAQQGHDPMLLRGIFADGFNTLEKLDEGLVGLPESVTHTVNGVEVTETLPLTYVAYSFEDAEITLPFKEEKQNDMTILNSTTGSGWRPMTSWGEGRILTSPYKRVTLINQPIATGIMNVNPYMVFGDTEGILKLSPANDNWISKEQVTITNTTSKTYRVNKWWLHNGETRNSDSEFIKANQNSIDWDGGKGINTKQKGIDGNTRIGTITSNGGTNTIETVIDYMRKRTVKITATGLSPNMDNMYLTFNGIKVDLVPNSGYAGTRAGTVKSNPTGKVMASFEVPDGQRCGSVDVELKSPTDTIGKTTSAGAIYTAQGIKRTVENIINKVRVTTKLYDPLAQSFQVLDDRIIAGVGLYFQSKDANVPVTVQIRGMSDGGHPNRTIYAERVLQPADVLTSTKGTTVTPVYFDDPLMAKAGDTYAIVVVTDSANYNMFIAKMGSTYLTDTKKKLTTQAYAKGVLFSSSNAQTWTPHQDSDMKFQVYATEFKEGESTVQFDTINGIDMDKLLLTASYLTPQNTGCRWEIRYVLEGYAEGTQIETQPWVPIGNFIDIDPTSKALKAQLRATFYSNKYMSPMFALDDFSLMSFLTETRGSYIGKTVDMVGAEYDTINITYQYYAPELAGANPVTLRLYVGDPLVNGQFVFRTLAQFRNPTDVTEVGNTVTTEFIGDIDLNGFRTVKHTIVVPKKNLNKFKVRIDLKTATPVARPRVKALRCTLTDEH